MALQGRSFFLSPSHNLFIFQKLKPDPQREAWLFCYVCRERERNQATSVFITALKHIYIAVGEEEARTVHCLIINLNILFVAAGERERKTGVRVFGRAGVFVLFFFVGFFCQRKDQIQQCISVSLNTF